MISDDSEQRLDLEEAPAMWSLARLVPDRGGQ
jgi:hypothetical protein